MLGGEVIETRKIISVDSIQFAADTRTVFPEL